MNLPEGLRPQRILGLDGNELQALTGKEKAFEFTIPKFLDGTVIFLELAKPGGNHEEF